MTVYGTAISNPQESNIIKICLNIVACQDSEPDPLWGSLSPYGKRLPGPRTSWSQQP